MGRKAWRQDPRKRKKNINKRGECEVEHEVSGRTQINEACENAYACIESTVTYTYIHVYIVEIRDEEEK